MRIHNLNRMLTGLFGGSFNPPHIGHIVVITDILKLLPFNKVYFVPTRIPPHKNKSSLLDAKHRLNMLNLAVSDIRGMEISSFEIENDSISYSYLTINHFLKVYGIKAENLFFILGLDAFLLIKTWKNYPDILEKCNFLILSRPMDTDSRNLLEKLKKEFTINPIKNFIYGNKRTGIYYMDNIMIDISSSVIRKRIKEGLSVKYLVPQNVEEYILNNHLYQNIKEC